LDEVFPTLLTALFFIASKPKTNFMRQLKITKQVTNREIASLDKYLHEIGKVELITAEEEVKLAQLIKQGDSLALEKLTKANLRFVVSVSKQYQNQGLSLPDLINEGNLGLIKAAQRFDETRGFKFISYAVWWIRQSILQALAEQARIVRLPLNKIGAINRVKKVSILLEQELGRAPEPEEIAKKLEISLKDVKNLLRNTARHLSVDAPLIQDEDNTMLDMMGSEDGPTPEKGLLHESLRKEIERAVSTLSFREADIIRMYYGLNGKNPLTLEEIAQEFELTRERVRQIKEKGIKRLKQASRCRNLKTYLG
jgi:RNA polymerase primary sigma factor